MLGKLKELGKHSLIYGLGNALSVVGGFILIPFYTYMLATSEYGTLELLNRTADILIVFIMLGVRQAFIRFYFDHDTDDWHQTVLGTTTVFMLVSSVTMLILFWPMKDWLAKILFDDPVAGILFVYIIVWIPFDLMVQLGLTHLQIRMKSVTYVIINFLKFLAFIVSNVILLYYFDMGIVGVLVTNIWIAVLFGTGFLVRFYKLTHFVFSIDLLKKLISFGLPYLPTMLFGFILYNSSRYFLTIYSSLDAVGIYALASKIGFVGVVLVMDPFAKIWSPFLFDNYKNEDGPRLIARVFTITALVGFTVALAISISAPIIIPLITEKSYHAAYEFIPFISLASVFYGLAMISDYGILISKKTVYKPMIFAAAALVAVITNFIFVPLYAGIGAAISFAISLFALFVINFEVSNKLYKVSLEYKKLFVIAFGAVLVFVIADIVINIEIGNIYYQGLSLMTFLIYPVILWMGGLLTRQEKQFLLMLTSRKKHKAAT